MAKCLGREIHPQFRENFCDQKRFHPKSFPCDICDLNSDNKIVVQKKREKLEE